MNIKIDRFITGTFTERYDAEYVVRGTIVVNYEGPGGVDSRDLNKQAATDMSKKAREVLINEVKDRIIASAISELQAKAKDGLLITELLPGKLVLINPRKYQEEVSKREYAKEEISRSDRQATIGKL